MGLFAEPAEPFGLSRPRPGAGRAAGDDPIRRGCPVAGISERVLMPRPAVATRGPADRRIVVAEVVAHVHVERTEGRLVADEPDGCGTLRQDRPAFVESLLVLGRHA